MGRVLSEGAWYVNIDGLPLLSEGGFSFMTDVYYLAGIAPAKFVRYGFRRDPSAQRATPLRLWILCSQLLSELPSPPRREGGDEVIPRQVRAICVANAE